MSARVAPGGLLTTLAAIAVAVVLAACGGGRGAHGDAPAAVRSTVRRAFTAVADDRGAAFCALATPALQAVLAHATHGASCRRVVTLVATRLSFAQREALRHVQIAAVTVSGDRATVSDGALSATRGSLSGFIGGGASATALARQPDGSWKLDG